MQNAQNTEIQQRVINLVELYRTKVGKESQIAKQAKADYEYWEKESMDDEFGLISYGEGPHTEMWIKHLMVNEQLLGHFYKKTGREIEGFWKDYAEIGNYNGKMLPDEYDDSVFTSEEESFLASHFKELVNYIIQTPSDDLEWVHRLDNKDRLLIPDEMLALIESRAKIEKNSIVYNPNTGFAQFATHFRQCKFICDDSHPWTRLTLFANGTDAKFVERGCVPETYDVVTSIMDGSVAVISQAYAQLRDGGKMILICPSSILYKKDTVRKDEKVLKKEQEAETFRARLVTDGSIVEIVQLPDVMSSNWNCKFSLIIVEKGYKGDTTMIDARYACKKSDRKNFSNVLDLEALAAMFQNNGNDTETGLRKMVTVPTADINADMLLPQVYVIERPSMHEHAVPLSALCSLVSKKVKEVQFDLPEDTPWVTRSDLTLLYTGDLDITHVKKADCPNNPTFVQGNDAFNRDIDFVFVDEFWDLPENAHLVWEYRRCTFLDGKSDAVLFELDPKEGARIALFKAYGKPIAVSSSIQAFCPKSGFDTYSLAAILRQPVVYRQIQTYQGLGLEKHLDDILVPTDKQVIGDEKQRMLKEVNVVGNLENSLNNMRKSVRMRKHALTQSISSVEAMFYALNAYREKHQVLHNEDVISRVKKTTVQEAFEYIAQSLNDLMPALEHIAAVEYSFGKPEWIDPEKFVEEYIEKNEKGWMNFKPIITWEQGHNQAAKELKDPFSGDIVLRKGDSISLFLFPKDALERVFNNILSNAEAHAYTDKSRNDYQLRFSWHTDGEALVVEIDNNGTPIPDDRDTASLLEYGVSTNLHNDGHNGIGCNEIDDIMKRYEGKVEIVSSPKEEFTVKYILTFNRFNTVRSFKL